MYDDHSVQIPQPEADQNPTPKPRSISKAYEMRRSQHMHQRMQERGYTSEQVLQTYVYGHQIPDPKGTPGVSHFLLPSAAHRDMMRRIVVNEDRGEYVTAYPRVPVAEAIAPPKPAEPQSSTKKKQREQLARKRARSTSG